MWYAYCDFRELFGDGVKISREKIIKAAINIAVIAITLFLIIIAVKSVLPGFLEKLANGDKEEIKNYLAGFHDFEGYAIAFLLQFIQIITIFLPSIPIQLAVGAIFGARKGFLICYAGYVLASLLVFAVSRALGGKLDKLFPKRRAEIDEIQKKRKRFITDAEHPAFMVLLASILPILPNGFIPYIAARTKIKFTGFLAAVGIGCIPTVLTLCAVGNHITVGKWWAALLYAVPLLVLVAVMFWQQKNIIKLYSRAAYRAKKLKEKQKGRNRDLPAGILRNEKTDKASAYRNSGTDFPNGE